MKYGSRPFSLPTPRKYSTRFFSSTRSNCVTFQSPLVIWFFSLPGSVSYRYRWPQLSRSLNQISSFDAAR